MGSSIGSALMTGAIVAVLFLCECYLGESQNATEEERSVPRFYTRLSTRGPGRRAAQASGTSVGTDRDQRSMERGREGGGDY